MHFPNRKLFNSYGERLNKQFKKRPISVIEFDIPSTPPEAKYAVAQLDGATRDKITNSYSVPIHVYQIKEVQTSDIQK